MDKDTALALAKKEFGYSEEDPGNIINVSIKEMLREPLSSGKYGWLVCFEADPESFTPSIYFVEVSLDGIARCMLNI